MEKELDLGNPDPHLKKMGFSHKELFCKLYQSKVLHNPNNDIKNIQTQNKATEFLCDAKCLKFLRYPRLYHIIKFGYIIYPLRPWLCICYKNLISRLSPKKTQKIILRVINIFLNPAV